LATEKFFDSFFIYKQDLSLLASDGKKAGSAAITGEGKSTALFVTTGKQIGGGN